MTKSELIGTKEQRLTRIGGSEFATILDINPYKKRIELVLEKAGVIVNTFEGNEATRRGQFLENDIIAMFEEATGLKVNDEQKEFTISPNDCLPLVCHVDGITSNNAVFEAKTTDINSKTWKDGIPEHYKAQLDFNCNLSGRSRAYIAVGYCKDNEIVKFEHYIYTVDRTMKEIVTECNEFTKEVEKFKTKRVVNNGRIVKSCFDDSLIDELEKLNSKIAEIKLQAKVYEENKKIIEEKIKKEIGNNSAIETNLYKITLGNRIIAPSFEYKISRSGIKIEYLK